LTPSPAAPVPDSNSEDADKLAALRAAVRGARAILEAPELGGHKTVWLARAKSPDGVLVLLQRKEA
jgi:hypothetical protein